MILFSSPASPFGRKIKLALHATGMQDNVEVRIGDTGDPDSEFKKFFAKLDFATAKKSEEADNDVEEVKDEPVEEEEVHEPISYMEVPEKLICTIIY